MKYIFKIIITEDRMKLFCFILLFVIFNIMIINYCNSFLLTILKNYDNIMVNIKCMQMGTSDCRIIKKCKAFHFEGKGEHVRGG